MWNKRRLAARKLIPTSAKKGLTGFCNLLNLVCFWPLERRWYLLFYLLWLAYQAHAGFFICLLQQLSRCWILGISGLNFYFYNPQKFIVYGQKSTAKWFAHNKIAHAAAIKTLMQQLPHANTAIARDLVSAFGPLLYGPHSYWGS